MWDLTEIEDRSARFFGAEMPRFSIVITTRNRADLVASSLLSVLEQDYNDFEAIVSDNSDSDESKSVEESVRPFLEDHRVRYVRPERPLPMTSHWEWAVSQARGDYVGILTDRMLLRLSTLSALNQIIDEIAPQIIAYERDNLIETQGNYSVPEAKNQEIIVSKRRSAKIVKAFSASDFRPMDTPRFLNSFASKEFLSKLRTEYGSVFTGIAPDYGFLMRVLDCLDEFPFIETPLLIKHSEERSNGKSFTHLNLTKAANDFISFSSGEQQEFLKFSPLPDDQLIITNVMMREYEIGRRHQKSGKFPAFDTRSIYRECLSHIYGLRRAGRNVDALLERMERYRKDHDLQADLETKAQGV